LIKAIANNRAISNVFCLRTNIYVLGREFSFRKTNARPKRTLIHIQCNPMTNALVTIKFVIEVKEIDRYIFS